MSSPASGYMRFAYGATSIDVPIPIYPYASSVRLPLDVVRLDSGKYAVYDHGTAYDVRECEIDFELSETDAATFAGFLAVSAYGRAGDIQVSFNADSGIHLFGPDRSAIGPFTVAVVGMRDVGIGHRPYKYFKYRLTLVNTGTWPTYSLPTQVDDGSVQMGTVQKLRFPQDWFKPEIEFKHSVTITEGADAYHFDRGIGGDRFDTSYSIVSNRSKMAALLEYLAGTARGNTFSVVVGDDSYLFSERKSDSGTYTVRLIAPTINITHEMYNRFTAKFDVSYVSGPA